MLQTPSLVLSLALALANGAFAANNAPITDVTLYPDSATVTRAIHVAPGTAQIELRDLPSSFDKNSVRVKADTGIRVGQVVVDEEIDEEDADKKVAELQSKIDALQDKKGELDAESKSAELIQHFLEKLNNTPDHAQALDAKTLATTIDTVHRSAADSFGRIQKIAEQKRDIDKQINVLQEKLNVAGYRGMRFRSIKVTLDARQAGIVRLSYQSKTAGWKPGYRASLNSSTGAMELERIATVRQLTHEDWRGVNLTLSTGHPSISVDAADPQTRTISYSKPSPQPKMSYQRQSDSNQVQRIEVTGSNITAKFDDAQEMLNTYATLFTVPAIVNVPSDLSEISVDLSKQTLNVSQHLQIVPRLQAYAVLTVEAPRPEGVWPEGDVQLYRDGDYVGVSHWTAADADRLRFSFGRDDLVNVKINRAQQQSSSGGFLSSQRDQHIADTFTITSAHKSPIDILVLESSPVSDTEEVKVKSQFQPQPTLTNWENRNGVVGWETQLPANGKFQITTSYDIDYPKDGVVANLP